MTQEQTRSCAECPAPLPESARATRKYCSPRCRQAASRKRSRNESIGTNVRWRLDEQRKENTQLIAANQRTRRALDKQRQHNQRLKSQLADRDAYIEQQAEKVAAARRKATQLRIERDTAVREAAHSSIDPDHHHQMREELQSLHAAHEDLQKRYDDLADALEGAAKEREFFRQVVRSWDRLCNVLYKQLKGEPRSEKDRETLALWTRFREQVGRPVKPIRKETI